MFQTLNCRFSSPFGKSGLKIRGGIALIATALISSSALLTSCGGGSEYGRGHIDRYLELEEKANLEAHAMNPGVSVYVDFSDGMNAAYGTGLSQDVLRRVINVFTGANNQASFFSLANDEITPLDLPQTEVYNAIMSGKNYDKPRAPIEKTLKEIVEKKQSCLLITDFEEYNGAVIQQQNYAKDYFIEWLSSGNDIVFYKIDYKEKAKDKKLYFVVFDSAANGLANLVEQAVSSYVGQGLDKFVLGGPEFAYGMMTGYPSSTQGGNYRNSKGEDLVSAVFEDGGGESYKTYQKTVGSTMPVIEYYPLGEKWGAIISNINALQEEGVEKEDRFNHFLSKIFVNFSSQNGYDISDVAVRAVDFEPVLTQYVLAEETAAQEETEVVLPAELPECREVRDMFTASMTPVENDQLQGEGWYELALDFDTRFKGDKPASMNAETDLLKVDIAVGKATPQLDKIDAFFSWPGNNSLSESVRNTLNSPKVNPTGRSIVTYYLRCL